MRCCKALSCGTVSKCKGQLFCAGMCFLGAVLCFFSVGPVFMGTLATPVTTFEDCISCGADYAAYVVNTMDGSGIVDKIIDAHSRHESIRDSLHRRHRHHHRHHGHHEDVCITGDDLKGLSFDDLDVQPLPETCIETCAPIGRRALLAAACAVGTFLCAAAAFACSLFLLVRALVRALWCKRAGQDAEEYFKVSSVSPTHHDPALQGPVGTAAGGAENMKAPLLSADKP